MTCSNHCNSTSSRTLGHTLYLYYNLSKLDLKVGSYDATSRIFLVLNFVPGYGRFYETKYF